MATESAPEPHTGSQAAVSEEQKGHAKQVYQEGLAAYRAGQYSEAIDKLLEANRIMPNGAFSYNIALVYQAMGDKRSALRWLRDYLRQNDEKDDKAADKVRALEAELQSRGLQQVTVLSEPAGATLRVDGNALGITPFTTEIVPGAHTVTLSLESYKTAQQSFELRPDRSMDVHVVLEPVPPVANSAPESPPAPVISPTVVQPAPALPQPMPVADSVRSSRSPRPLTWASLGVGAGLLGGSVIFELMRASAEKEARKAPQVDYQSDYDTMKSRQTMARIFAVAGGVAVATGAVLLTVDLSRRGRGHTAAVGPCPSGGFCTSFAGQF